MASWAFLIMQPEHSHVPGLGFQESRIEVVDVVLAGLVFCCCVGATVVLALTAENTGAGMLAKMADVDMGTAGPSFSTNGEFA